MTEYRLFAGDGRFLCRFWYDADKSYDQVCKAIRKRIEHRYASTYYIKAVKHEQK